jgi:hypothetical protein
MHFGIQQLVFRGLEHTTVPNRSRVRKIAYSSVQLRQLEKHQSQRYPLALQG